MGFFRAAHGWGRAAFFQQNLLFIAEKLHRFLFWNPLKIRVKRQKQSLELFFKKWCS